MKPQTGAYLDKARELLQQADTVMSVGLNEAAARTAYMAALHAARALIFENTDEITSSHQRVQSQFWMLAKEEPRIDHELRAFLSRAYKFKQIADYDTGPAAHITPETARDAVATARRFVDCVAALIPPNGHIPQVLDTPKPT
jgi:uncharacterized protein (UPF0332 family)